MITVEHLTKMYRQTTAVDDVSFTVGEGKTLVLLGTSGSGKTTTLRMINRLIEPTSGTITINGKNSLLQPPEVLRRGMGYVLQGYGLFPHYTVAENIAVVPKLLKWSPQKISRRVDELLAKLGLPEPYKTLYPDQLSGGQKQRVGLARALAADPPILLLDEPFGALDPLTRTTVRNEFKHLDELKKKTIILVTHDVQEAFELGNVIGLMDNGRLQQLGLPLQLLLQPANDFVRDFFQHQRVQLEWQALTLKHFWTAFPDAAKNDNSQVKSNDTIWHTIALLAQTKEPLTASDEETNTAKEITFSHLQTALQKSNPLP